MDYFANYWTGVDLTETSELEEGESIQITYYSYSNISYEEE